MSQYQELTRYFLAAGATACGEKSTIMLYAAKGTLVSKHWTGERFSTEEHIASFVRPGSTASYIITQSDKLVVCISTDNKLRVLHYDEDEEEWADVEDLPRFRVHPDGHVTAVPTGETDICIVFQNAHGELVVLDADYIPTMLPVTAVAGTPLAVGLTDSLHVYYISSKDNALHGVSNADGCDWQDDIFANIGDLGLPKRFILASDSENGSENATVLTKDYDVVLAPGKGSDGYATQTVLGSIKDGEFIPSTSAECACLLRFFFPWFFKRPKTYIINVNGDRNSVFVDD